MVIVHGYDTVPHHRQNRRRERPGSRTRNTSRKSRVLSNVQNEYHEAILDARDATVSLPSSYRSKPSSLLRQNFHQSWERWQAKQAEEKAVAEMDKMQLEQEQIKLFGGDLDDDELYRMGILYHDEDTAQESSNSIALDVPVQQSPVFVIRPSKPRKRTHRSTWRTLPLYLSLSDLSKDPDLMRLLSPSHSRTPAIQHRDISSTTDIPLLSLPPTPALESHLLDNTISISSPPILNFNSGDWTFIDAAPHTLISSPSSEPETWILLSDGS